MIKDHQIVCISFFFQDLVSFFDWLCYYRKMLIDLCKGVLKSHIDRPSNKIWQKLFLLFDFMHNFKTSFNNFLTKCRMNVPTSGFEDVLYILAYKLSLELQKKFSN